MDQPNPGMLDQAYAAPRSQSLSVAAVSAARLRSRAGKLLLASFTVFAASIAVIALASSLRPGVIFFLVAALLAAVGAGYGLVALIKGVGASAGGSVAATALGLMAVNVAMSCIGAFAAMLSTMSFSRGRQIRRFGKILLPPVEAGAAWTRAAIEVSSVDIDDGDTRRALASQWRENGRTEHASVAAFARLTLDLMALGAPPALVADANRDALDEIRHTELCFGLARSLDGRVESPGAFPQATRARARSSKRVLALGQLAVDSLVDGALREGVSARIIAKLARRCAVPTIQVMLKEIAADEGRHARHGWDVVLWCLEEGGEPIARALEGAVRAVPRKMASPMPDAARQGGWERFGIMGEALEVEEFTATRAHVERRVAEAIAASRASRQALGYGNVSVG